MSQRKPGSLGLRLSGWLALQALAGLLAASVAVYAAMALNFASRQSELLLQKQTQVEHLLSESAEAQGSALLLHKLDDFFIGHTELSLVLRRADGSILYERSANHGPAAGLRTVSFAAAAPSLASETITAALTLDTRADERTLEGLRSILLAAALVASALISAGGFLFVRLALRPLRELVDQTRELAADTLSQRLDGGSQVSELQPLVTQFNDLLGRLLMAYQQVESFNLDVAHELCTPLTTLIGGTEVALRRVRTADELREVLGSNLEELQRLSRIVQDMLFLSRADRGSTARRTPTSSLAAVATKLADYHEAALEAAGVILEVNGDATGQYDLPLIERALSNLIGNATRFADSATAIRVEIEPNSGDEVRISVVNRGKTIEAAHLPRLFDRFFRGDPARRDAGHNHGLGLAIVAAVARMHGGAAFAQSSQGVSRVGFTLKRR